MKYIWEPIDINPGRKLQASNRTEVWMIGYDPSINTKIKYALISTQDGMITIKGHSIDQMVEYINDAEMRPVDIDKDYIQKED